MAVASAREVVRAVVVAEAKGKERRGEGGKGRNGTGREKDGEEGSRTERTQHGNNYRSNGTGRERKGAEGSYERCKGTRWCRISSINRRRHY